MLTRSIDFDAADPTIEEKVFVAAKRICIVFAVAALSISALDLMNVRAVEAAAEFVHDRGVVMASLRDGLQNFSFGRREEVATAFIAVPIPAATFAKDTTRPQSVDAMIRQLTDSPVEQLAAVSHQDAVETAMILDKKTRQVASDVLSRVGGYN